MPWNDPSVSALSNAFNTFDPDARDRTFEACGGEDPLGRCIDDDLERHQYEECQPMNNPFEAERRFSSIFDQGQEDYFLNSFEEDPCFKEIHHGSWGDM